QHMKRAIHCNKLEFIMECKIVWLSPKVNIIHYILEQNPKLYGRLNRSKILSKIQPSFITNTLKLDTEGNFLNLIKGVYEKLIVNTMLNREHLTAFLPDSGTRPESLLL
ncbi:LORF2 protein, partial [Crocuta crocuta]